MKKLMISLTIAALSFNVIAQTEEEELKQTEGFYKSESLGYMVHDSTNELVLSIQKSIDSDVKAFPVILVFDQECHGHEDSIGKAKSAKINGELVQLVTQCFKENWLSFYPKTEKGQNYFELILRTRNILRFSEFTFKTKGYNKFSKKILDESAGM